MGSPQSQSLFLRPYSQLSKEIIFERHLNLETPFFASPCCFHLQTSLSTPHPQQTPTPIPHVDFMSIPCPIRILKEFSTQWQLSDSLASQFFKDLIDNDLNLYLLQLPLPWPPPGKIFLTYNHSNSKISCFEVIIF